MSYSKYEVLFSISSAPANMLCYFSGRRLVLQTRGRWFESTTEYHHGLGRLGIPYSAQLRLLGEIEVRDDS